MSACVIDSLTVAGAAIDRLLAAGQEALRRRQAAAGADALQYEVHGLAWIATYGEALRQLGGWAARLRDEGRFGEVERRIVTAAAAEYAGQIGCGIAMSQTETIRPERIGIDADVVAQFRAAVAPVVERGNDPALLPAIAQAAVDGAFGEIGLDETHTMVREGFRRFADAAIAPDAHGWHLRDELIPMEIVERMGEMGVFGLTIPEAYGGLGMGKVAMAIVSEELSRGYIGVGSLGTRSEIAAELILAGGTAAQKARYLPLIASGAILPTAVFTEPDTGSDLASLRTRAVRDGDTYAIAGAKTWITHASRSDLMTLLARTGRAEDGYRGLSMFLAEKPRGTQDAPFPAPGMSGGEIAVLGYRGMKEYELGFDGFTVPASALLGGEEGRGFKQLMATFESARIQTAARAVGVAQNALELGLGYAVERRQFGGPLIEKPRVSAKIGWMVVETMLARQLTLYAAREKDRDRRCDLEAGMTKLLAARVAWSNADCALQIHGGNGFALEYPISRVLCDARILSIFEGAAEIQAAVIGRRLLAD